MKYITKNPASEQPLRRPNNVSKRPLAAHRANSKKGSGLKRFTSCLPSGDKEGYREIGAWFHDRFCPTHPITFGMVDDLATTRRRLAHLVKMENCVIREQMVRTRPQTEKRFTQLSAGVEVAFPMRAVSNESSIPARPDRGFGRQARLNPDLVNWQFEPIPTNGHPVAPELPTIANADGEATVVMITQNGRSERRLSPWHRATKPLGWLRRDRLQYSG